MFSLPREWLNLQVQNQSAPSDNPPGLHVILFDTIPSVHAKIQKKITVFFYVNARNVLPLTLRTRDELQ